MEPVIHPFRLTMTGPRATIIARPSLGSIQ
ncbi:hypothetical protein HNQ61_004215 [Longimicrobium terrae]|uniref:Uncharacterized protein n=1 Tax=Longimicrobium terrae TaxID=1639882 RepID=A0A841H3M1_9BACT|nr:hypothetical protein [Longimicrobium terrae]